MPDEQTTRSESVLQVRGPYSIHVTSKEHIVRGRHGAIIRRYPNASKDAAMEDLRRLQKGYDAAQKRMRDAAPKLYAAAIKLLSAADKGDSFLAMDGYDDLRAIVAEIGGAA